MGLFDGLEKSKAQLKYESIMEKSPQVFAGEKARCKAVFDELWDGLETVGEAQEVLNLFGTDACDLFGIHRAWQDFLKEVDPAYEYLTPPFNIQFNEDGTVTVLSKIETEE